MPESSGNLFEIIATTRSMRKISETSTEELEAVAQEAREELEQLTEEEQAVVRDAVTKAVH